MPDSQPVSDQAAYAYSEGRPVLKMVLIGLNGRSISVLGLLDTGATFSGLRIEDALALGFSADELDEGTTTLADGSKVQSFEALSPVTATIEGRSEPTFELWPSFLRTDHAVWGRDLLALMWRVTFCQREGWVHFAFTEQAATGNGSKGMLVPETVSHDEKAQVTG